MPHPGLVSSQGTYRFSAVWLKDAKQKTGKSYSFLQIPIAMISPQPTFSPKFGQVISQGYG